MSENLNRGTRDFSQYDAMETEKLEEILRLDAEAPEDTESDTELLLYVMEVLASRRNNSNITGNTAQEAWESFQKHYMPEECLEKESAKERKLIAAPWVRRMIAAVAAVALVVIIPISARAFGYDSFWDAIAHWAKDTFSFVNESATEINDPDAVSKEGYTSLHDLLEKSGLEASFVPTWIPDGFVLETIEKHITPAQEIYRAFYLNGDKELKIRIQTLTNTDFQNIETSDSYFDIYNNAGVDYHILTNMDQLQVIWIFDSYECTISGDLSIEQAKQMINSIKKG